MSRKPPRLLLGAVLAALALTACTGRASDPAQDSTNNTDAFQPGIFHNPDPGEPTSGGTLTLADLSETRSLDPVDTIPTGSSGGTVMVALYDQLIRYDAETDTYYPQVAETVEANEDSTQWTVTLRQGVTFSDGTPLDADAVVASVNRYVANGGYDMAVIGPYWKGIVKLDARTVRFDLSAPWATFDALLGQGMGFVVAPAAGTTPEEFQPIGAGAFTFGNYAPQEELVLAANPDYWNGAPYLDQLRFVWLGADETKLDAFNGDSVQAIYVRSPEIVQQLRQEGTAGFVGLEGLGDMIMISGTEGRPGADEKVREALAMAIDPEAIYDRVHDGTGLPTKKMFHEVSRWSNDVEPAPYDPDRARELLDEAMGDGFDGTVELISPSDPVSRDKALAIAAQLEAAGFTVDNQYARTIADWVSEVFVNRNFELARGGYTIPEQDPHQRLFSQFHVDSVARIMPTDSEMSALVDELRETPTEDRHDVLARIEQRFQDFHHGIGLGTMVPLIAWADNVHGVVGTNELMQAYDKAWIAN